MPSMSTRRADSDARAALCVIASVPPHFSKAPQFAAINHLMPPCPARIGRTSAAKPKIVIINWWERARLQHDATGHRIKRTFVVLRRQPANAALVAQRLLLDAHAATP